MKTSRIMLAGGSGFLGQSLAVELLARNYEVIILTRSPKNRSPQIKEIFWDGKTLGDWKNFLNEATALVNFTGKSVNCRHTPENRRVIRDSRIDSVKILNAAILQCAQPPRAFVQCSTLAIYGNPGDKICEETAAFGHGFSEEIAQEWEKVFHETPTPATRKVILRIGFALGRNGGPLEILSSLTKYFLGGTVGNGRQYISWIHQADLNQMFLWGIEHAEIEGAFNATSFDPVTSAEFMRELRGAWHRPWSPPAPEWLVNIGAWLLRTEPSLALTGRRCLPKRFSEKGFQFQFPNLREALQNLATDLHR
ncbi:MAG: TIGR01777 family oxidoreductase [Verrucomicrobiota bacterium]|nr:TIGR01777 family oxidoreductase [Verrucomicrobiota bacterium]